MPSNTSINRLRQIGYTKYSEQQLLDLFLNQGSQSLRDVGGEYILILEGVNECALITSPVGAMHYYYYYDGSRFCHGERIIDILGQASLPWQWNWFALGDLCQLENLTNNQTLHPSIRRVPPGACLHYKNNQLDLDANCYIDSIPLLRPDPNAAVEAMNQEVATWSGNNPYLSLSGGFDSRVILGSMLQQGIQPHVITMGNDQCSDVRTAKAIASEFNLTHDLIRININDFFEHAPRISELTNGTKSACHWHTYLYPLKARIPTESSFFVGTLGEFARSYYFDKGHLGRLAKLNPNWALHKFWNMKLSRHPTFLANEISSLNSQFAEQLYPAGINDRANRLTSYCKHQFLPGLARYYFEQRVPNFYANGIKMYMDSSQWRSPFHSRRWIDQIWNLPESWKLGSNWHRYAITKNMPKLLKFPEENGFVPGRMLAKAPPLYWTSAMRTTSYISYDLSSEWYRDPQLQDFIYANRKSIDDLIDPALVASILVSHKSGEDRTRTLAFLLTMIYWKQNLHLHNL
jgi:asparagine synthase (glutamine-hydrolysing)